MTGQEKVREARCGCGQLTISVSGEPKTVIACSCGFCQRRTGAVMQQCAWFVEEQVTARSGERQTYQPPDVPSVLYHFCPECGSTVYWDYIRLSGLYSRTLIGIGCGSFADADFPRPQYECWSSKRHSWLGDVGAEGVFEEALTDLPVVD